MVIEVTNENLTQIIEENSLVLIDFWAPWCGPCKIFAPMFNGIEEDGEINAAFVKVNVDEQPDIAQKFGVLGVPTVVAVRDGEVVASGTGIPKIMPIMDKAKEGLL